MDYQGGDYLFHDEYGIGKARAESCRVIPVI